MKVLLVVCLAVSGMFGCARPLYVQERHVEESFETGSKRLFNGDFTSVFSASTEAARTNTPLILTDLNWEAGKIVASTTETSSPALLILLEEVAENRILVIVKLFGREAEEEEWLLDKIQENLRAEAY